MAGGRVWYGATYSKKVWGSFAHQANRFQVSHFFDNLWTRVHPRSQPLWEPTIAISQYEFFCGGAQPHTTSLANACLLEASQSGALHGT